MTTTSRNFAHPSYVEEYLTEGKYPKIHSRFNALVLENTHPGETVMDLGGCTGLHAAYLRDHHRRPVIVEPNTRYLTRGKDIIHDIPVHVPNLHDPATYAPGIIQFAKDYGVTTIAARRVIPEIIDNMGETILQELLDGLRNIGVNRLILQGRVPSPRATSPASNIHKEARIINRLIHPTITIEDPYALIDL